MALTIEDIKKYREERGIQTNSGPEAVQAARARMAMGLPAIAEPEPETAAISHASKRIQPARGRARDMAKAKSVIRGALDPEASAPKQTVGTNPPEKKQLTGVDKSTRAAASAAKRYGVAFTGDPEETLRTAGREAYSQGKAADSKSLFDKADGVREMAEAPDFQPASLNPATEKNPYGVDNIPVYSGQIHEKYGLKDYLGAGVHAAAGTLSGMSNSVVHFFKAFNDLGEMGLSALTGQEAGHGLQPLWDLYDRLDANTQAQITEDIRTGKMSEPVYSVISGLVQQIPTIALAILTGGGSVAAEGATAALGNPSAVEAGIKMLPQLFKDPQFLHSFIQSFGGTYKDAVENGANPAQAFLAGIVDGLPEAAIEVGGGLETALSEGPVTGVKDLVRRVGKSALEEGWEEIRQDPFSGLAQMTYDPGVNKFSLTDDDAVVNPVRAAKSAFYAFITSSISGGVGTTMRTAQDYYTLGDRVKESGNVNSMLLSAMDSQNETLRDQAAEMAYQIQHGKDPSAAAVGRLALMVGEELNREQVRQVPSMPEARQGSPLADESQQQISENFQVTDPELRHTAALVERQSPSEEQQPSISVRTAEERQSTRQQPSSTPSVKAEKPFSASLTESLGENGKAAYHYTIEHSDTAEDGVRPAFLAYYTYGLAGSNMENVPAEFARSLGQDGAYRAWAAGQNDARITLAQEQKAAKYAAVAGTDSGLVYDDFVREAVSSGRSRVDVNGESRVYLTAETAEQLNQVARALGVRVQFADSIRGGTANAKISGSTILMEKNNPNPVMAVVGHEFTHRMQELAPREYRTFRNSVLEGKENRVREKLDAYASQGVNLTYEEAMDEAAADLAGLMMDDGKVLDQFIEKHRTDRTLLQKIRDAIRSFIDKLTGKERKKAETTVGKLEAALDAAAKQARALQDKAGRDTMDVARHSLKEDGVDGREGTRRIGAVEQKEESDRAGGQPVQNSAGEVLQGDAVSRRERGLNTSFGERPYYAWTEGHVIEPVKGTVAHGAQQTAVEYGVPSFVVSNTAWNQSKTKAPSFSAHGQIFFRESIPERYRGMVAPHEITHVMKQVQYPAYLAFVSKTPDMLDLSSIEAALLLENSAKHREIDIFNKKGTLDTRKLKALSEADTLKLYDELNATLYGHIGSGKMEGLSEPLRHAFHDFDAYAKELTELHQRFKAENLNAKKNAGQADGDARYSIKYDESHTPYVEIDEDILRGIPKAAWVKTVKDNLRDKFPNGMTVGQNVIAINKQSRMEMTFSRYMQKLFQSEPQMYADKLRATNNADEIVRAAQNWVNEALLHPRKDDIIDFARGKVLLRIGENDYSAQVIVGNRGKNGLLLYDVINLSKTTIQEKTKTTDTVYTANTQNEPRDRGPVSVNTSISEKGENVNTNFSLKAGTITKSYEAILEENRLLKEQMKDYRDLRRKHKDLRKSRDYWWDQTKTTESAAEYQKAVAEAAKGLVEGHSSKANVLKIQGKLQGLYDTIGRWASQESSVAGDADYEKIQSRAESIARELVEQAVVRTSPGDSYQELLDYLKTTEVVLGKKDQKGFPGINGFKARQQDRLNLSIQGKTNIDQVYQELSERWPEFFDEAEQSHPADQLLRVGEVLDQLYAVEEYNPFEGEMDQAVTGAANEIMERFFDLPQTRKTFADRQEAKLDAAKANGKQQVQKVREEYKARLDKLRQQNRQRVADTIDKERAKRDQKIQALKDRYAARDAAGREKRAVREYQQKIRRTALDLSRRLLNPTDSKHIPESLRGPVAAFLSSIDFSGKKQDTKIAEVWRNLQNKWLELSAGQSREDFSGEYLTIDPDLTERLKELIASDVPTRLDNLNRAETEELWKVVAAVKAAVTAADRAIIEGKKTTAAEAGKDLILELSMRKARNPNQSSLSKNFADFFQYGMTDSTRFGEMFGPTMESLIGNLREGHNVMVRKWNEAVQYAEGLFGKEKVWEWGSGYADPKSFQLASGETLSLTPAQVMSLYLLNKREQGRRHLYKGGVESAETRGKHKRFGQGARTAVTEADVAQIINSLTPQQKRVADGLGYFLSHQAAEWGNEASMERFGYRKFTEENYFPIKSDRNYTRSSVESGDRPGTIAGLGMTKAVNKAANNPVLLEDVFDVFSRHVTEMAAYNAFYNRLEDFQAVWNWQDNRFHSVKDSLRTAGGDGANQYIRNLLTAVNGRATVERSLSETLLSKYKAGVIGGNLRVVIQQPTAYTRALTLMDGKYLLRGLAGKVDTDIMKTYAPIALWKDWGYYETGNGKQVKDLILGRHKAGDRFSEAMMALPGIMDNLTWGRLWKACEYEIADTTDLKAGTDEFYRAVGKRFTEIIDKTQVVDSVFHRSQIMRSKNFGNQLATAFMAEPTKSYNAVMGAIRSLQNVSGAEGLRVPGELLFRWQNTLLKCQGVYMPDEDIQRTIRNLRHQRMTNMNVLGTMAAQIFEDSQNDHASAPPVDEEALFSAAVDTALESGQISASTLQHRLKVGYNTASNLVNLMEKRRIIGPMEGAKPRQLLITKAQWQTIKSGNHDAGQNLASREHTAVNKDAASSENPDMKMRDFAQFHFRNVGLCIKDNQIVITTRVMTKYGPGTTTASFNGKSIAVLSYKNPRMFSPGYIQFLMKPNVQIISTNPDLIAIAKEELPDILKIEFDNNAAPTMKLFMTRIAEDIGIPLTVS